MPKRINYKPNEVYRFQIEMTGQNLIKLTERAEKLKRNLTNESSFLINELLTEFFEERLTTMSKGVKELVSKSWLPENQTEVTEKTFDHGKLQH